MSENAKVQTKKRAKRKRAGPEEQLAAEISGCEEEYRHWKLLYEEGGQDPLYADGVNLSLTRNHIVYHKRKIEELCAELGRVKPEIYYRELPPEVPYDYMAQADSIRKQALDALRDYESSKSYIALCSKKKELGPKQREEICLAAVLGYVEELRRAIHEDDLIAMRRHRDSERYLHSFDDCLKRAEQVKPETYQLSLFDMSA